MSLKSFGNAGLLKFGSSGSSTREGGAFPASGLGAEGFSSEAPFLGLTGVTLGFFPRPLLPVSPLAGCGGSTFTWPTFTGIFEGLKVMGPLVPLLLAGGVPPLPPIGFA